MQIILIRCFRFASSRDQVSLFFPGTERLEICGTEEMRARQ